MINELNVFINFAVRNEMPEQFSIGLKYLLSSDEFSSSDPPIRVLSIGCGAKDAIAKQYNKALRTACNSNTATALAIVSILMQHISVLNLNPNGRVGDPAYNAFELAEKRWRTYVCFVM